VKVQAFHLLESTRGAWSVRRREDSKRSWPYSLFSELPTHCGGPESNRPPRILALRPDNRQRIHPCGPVAASNL